MKLNSVAKTTIIIAIIIACISLSSCAEKICPTYAKSRDRMITMKQNDNYEKVNNANKGASPEIFSAENINASQTISY